MSQRDGCDPLRRVDWLAKPVTLRLDRERALKTASGGFISLAISISISIILAYRFTTEFYTITWEENEHHIGSENSYHQYHLQNSDMLFTLKTYSINSTLNDNLENYYTNAYVQVLFDAGKGKWVQKITPLVPCSALNLSDATHLSESIREAFYINVLGWQCFLDETGHQDIKLKGLPWSSTYKHLDETMLYGYFVVASCQELQNYTNNPNCVSLEESKLYTDSVASIMQIFSRNFNNYDSTQASASFDEFYIKETVFIGLVKENTQWTDFQLQIQNQTLHSNLLLSILKTFQTTTYQIRSSTSSLFGYQFGSDYTSIETSFVIYQLGVYQVWLDRIGYVKCFLSILAEAGSVLFTFIFIGQGLNDKLADFFMDNLIMKKIYTVQSNDDPMYYNKKFPEQKFEAPGLFYEYLNRLSSFDYSTCDWMRYVCCTFSCRCCCRFFFPRPADRIFHKARERLTSELDLIKIVKQMRISAFLNQMTFRQFQIDIIPAFSRYCVTDRRSVFDSMAFHPGQFVDDVPKRKADAIYDEEDMYAETVRLQRRRAMIAYKDSMAQINKFKLIDDFQTGFHIHNDPTDLEIIKNCFGEDYDPDKLEAIYQDIIDPPESVNEDPPEVINRDNFTINGEKDLDFDELGSALIQ